MTIDAANDTLNNPALENPETGETLQFTCPNPDCQGHNLLYKECFASEIRPVLFVKDNVIHWGETDWEDEDDDVHQFECSDCGYVLTDDNECEITHDDELVEWLKNHKITSDSGPDRQDRG